MADGKTIEVALSEEQLAVVTADVARGGYSGPAELVQEALWEWHAHHGLGSTDVEHMRRVWDEGVASGPSQTADLRDVFRGARARVQEAKANRER